MERIEKIARTVCFYANAVSRRKQVDVSRQEIEANKLKQCLSLWDLTFLGVGSSLGPGLYIISGQVARETAGPAVVISYVIAALACVFSALCYAEFAVRLPTAGSSYTYCYATLGELVAFIVGWNVIFENIVGFAAVAKAWSQYLDSFTNKTIHSHLEKSLIPGSTPIYFDVVAFALVLLATTIIISGAKVTTNANVIFTGINLTVCFLIFVVGLFFVDFANWKNFAPFGVTGVINFSKTKFHCKFINFAIDCKRFRKMFLFNAGF